MTQPRRAGGRVGISPPFRNALETLARLDRDQSERIRVDGLDAAAVAFDEHQDPQSAQTRLVETLKALAGAASAAAAALEQMA